MRPVARVGTWTLIAGAVRRRWLVVLIAVVVTPVVAVSVNKALPSRYKATAKVLIEESKAINPIMNDKMVDWNVKNRINVLQEIIRGNNILEKVLRQRGRIKDTDSPAAVEEKIARFRRDVELFGMGNMMAQITVTESSPDATYETLQLLVATFISEMLRPQKQSLVESAEFLKIQIERLRGELEVEEKELATYKAENATELPEVFHMNVDMTIQLKKAIFEAEGELQGALRKKEITEARLAAMSPAMRQVDAKLLEARSRLRDMRGSFTDDHPAVETQLALIRRLEAEHDELFRKRGELDLEHLESVASARGPVRGAASAGNTDLLATDILAYKSLLSEIEGARSKVAALKRRLAFADGQVRGVARNERSVAQMQRDVEGKSKMYRDLLNRYQETIVTRELALRDEKAQVWIVEPPVRPNHSTKPATPIVAVGGLLGGLVLGLVLAAVGELLSGIVRRDQVAGIAGVDLVGTLSPRGHP